MNSQSNQSKVKEIIFKIRNKLIFKQWIIGIYRGNIETIIKTKKFDPEINWIYPPSLNEFYADPFLLPFDQDNIKILFEDYKFNEEYGKLALMTFNHNFSKVEIKCLLDTNSHLSYPLILNEDNKYFVFPEAAESGKLVCYEFNSSKEELNFIKDILPLPLLDSTIFKYNHKYWLLGVIGNNKSAYHLNIYYSENLLGPYSDHSCNPVKSGLNGIRPAGKIIEVDGDYFRPTQNCENNYGESITINKITKLSERDFIEEPYMDININKKRKSNYGIHSIHTINSINNIIVLDAKSWTFSPYHQYKKYLRDKKLVTKNS